MPDYKRAFIPGGTWFFAVNLLERHRYVVSGVYPVDGCADLRVEVSAED